MTGLILALPTILMADWLQKGLLRSQGTPGSVNRVNFGMKATLSARLLAFRADSD